MQQVCSGGALLGDRCVVHIARALSFASHRRRSEDEAAGFRRAGDPVRICLGSGTTRTAGTLRRRRSVYWLPRHSKLFYQLTVFASSHKDLCIYVNVSSSFQISSHYFPV